MKEVVLVNGCKKRATFKCVGQADFGHAVGGLGPDSNALYALIYDIVKTYFFIFRLFFSVGLQVDFVAKVRKFVLGTWRSWKSLDVSFNIIQSLKRDFGNFHFDLFFLSKVNYSIDGFFSGLESEDFVIPILVVTRIRLGFRPRFRS